MSNTFQAVAEKLIDNEAGIGRLYELFSTAFPSEAELWTRLACDEQQHAAWIRQALEASAPEQRQRRLPSINLVAVEHMIRHVSTIAERCRRHELTRINALALGCDLENSLLENRLLGALGSATGPAAGLEESLTRSTTDHRNSLVKALNLARNSTNTTGVGTI